MNLCRHCNNPITTRNAFTYCSNQCQQDFQYEEYIKRWKDDLEKGYTGKTFLISPTIRKYLFLKYENKCCKCGWSKVNIFSNRIPLEVNHIDGDASNCKESNLELVCPNCHSLTANFRALNKASKRNRK